MLPKDRVRAAYEHRPTDRVPIYQAGFSSWAGTIVLGREAYVGGGIQQYREAGALWEGEEAHKAFLQRSQDDAFAIVETLDLDLVRPSYWRLPEKPTRRIDEYTFMYGDPDGDNWRVMTFNPVTELYQECDRAPRPEPTFADLEAGVAHAEERSAQASPQPEHYPDIAAAIERFGDTRAVPGVGAGLAIPRDRIWLEAIALRPDIVARYLDCMVTNAAKTAPVMMQLGTPYLCGGGDFAGPLGPLYSPRSFHELMAPRLAQISAALHEVGAYHGFASDGNLWPIADDLFGCAGVDFFYELDRRAKMDPRRVRERFPHLTRWGGIASETLHIGTVEDVRHETRTALEMAKECGSMIVGCSNQIVAGTPPANIEAMLNIMRDER